MSKPSEYLAAAAVMALRDSRAADVPTERAGLRALMEESYNIAVQDERMNLLLGQLAEWDMVTSTNDRFAGELLRLNRARSDEAWENAETDVLDQAWEWRDTLFERVFSNDDFWHELDSQEQFLEEKLVRLEVDDEKVPASDRVVTLTHNQFQQIAAQTDNLIDQVEADNGVPDEPGMRERALGQLKAGRELLRAGVFELELFKMSMIAGLNLLIEKYADRAIGATATVLLTVILHELGLPGF